MKTKLLFCGATVMALCLISCNSSRLGKLSDLTGEWTIVEVNGKNVTDIAVPENDNAPYLAFDTTNGRLFGNTGCNSIMGNFNTNSADGVIDLSRLGSTRMMCPDMQTEQAILSSLTDVRQYKIDGAGDIELCNNQGKCLMILRKRVSELSSDMLNGDWTIIQADTLDYASKQDHGYSMTFNTADSTFYCTTGCNNISGRFQSDFVAIKFNDIMQTEMACEDMLLETTMSQILPQITSFEDLSNGNIGFYNSVNDLILVISRK